MPAKLKMSFSYCDSASVIFWKSSPTSSVSHKTPVSSSLLPKAVQHASTVALGINHKADTVESRHLGEPQLSVLTLKSKDPCIKHQLHLVFLGKEAEEVAWESVLVHTAETHWQTTGLGGLSQNQLN